MNSWCMLSFHTLLHSEDGQEMKIQVERLEEVF